uniref:Uncharacterized protein n=1 Tax=Amphimedon queenslandica TaxID=400682 RepID=A0A1X7UNN5_AMPQE
MSKPLEILSTAFPGIGGKADARAKEGKVEEAGAEERAPPSSSVNQEGRSSGATEREGPDREVGTGLTRPAPETEGIPAAPDKPPRLAPETRVERSSEPSIWEGPPTGRAPKGRERKLDISLRREGRGKLSPFKGRSNPQMGLTATKEGGATSEEGRHQPANFSLSSCPIRVNYPGGGTMTLGKTQPWS